MQIVDLEKARLVAAAMQGAIKSAEDKGATTVDLTDVMMGMDDAARAFLVANIEAAEKAQRS